MAATRCWDHRKCGKEKDCPAYPDQGHSCWNVAGTLCRGEKQGTYGEKIEACREQCDFYAGVMAGTIKVT
jgi:methyl-accepting chemotaxis protein